VDPAELQYWTRRQGGADFTTFVVRVADEFEPEISDEHVGAGWFSVAELPEDLHGGCRVALERFQMDELGVAKAIRDGELTSPQRYMNVTLFALRITGTGAAFRPGRDEHVWRPPENYLTPEFLERCQGLAVVWIHPPKSALTSEEFAKRVIGSIMLPYVKDDEVWGIAKVYDDEAIAAMSDPERKLSTSPGVMGVGNNVAKLEDGSTVLVEQEPELLDHLAICDVGVWDKGGTPSGVASITGDINMSEAAKSAEELEADKKRADAATAETHSIDNTLAKLDAMCSGIADTVGKLAGRMDAYESEMKAEKDRKDSKKARKDRIDTLKARCDSGEASEEERKELKELEGGTAADSKKGRKDAEEATEEAKKLHEEEGKAINDSVAAAVAAAVEPLQRQIAELTRATATPSREEADAMADAQVRCDSVAQLFGEAAPRPLAGESLLAFRKRLVKPFVPRSPTWAGAAEAIPVMAQDAFDVAERQIYAEAAIAAKRPTHLPPGTLQMIVKTDPETGQKFREFTGDPEACWGRFKSPTRMLKDGMNGLNVSSQARH
jgi:hypothetical protein